MRRNNKGESDMIQLKKDINHIDETKLNPYESMLFIQMLELEYYRHLHSKNYAYLMYRNAKFNNDKLTQIFYKCQYLNHIDDINNIMKCILNLNKKFNLKTVKL